MELYGKTAVCSKSRRMGHCKNGLQKGCIKNGSKLERRRQYTTSSGRLTGHFEPRNLKLSWLRRPRKREFIEITSKDILRVN